MVTFRQLHEFDPERYRAWAGDYAKAARAVTVAGDQMGITGKTRLNAWTGQAGTAAYQRLTGLVTAADAVRQRCDGIDRALTAHTDAMLQARHRLREIVERIKRHGPPYFDIDTATGAITVYGEDANGAPLRPDLIKRRLVVVRGVAEQIKQTLAQAAVTDANTAARLRQIAQSTPPAAPAGIDKALADLRALGTEKPFLMRMWWNALTDQQKQYLIRAYPDQIGWIDGIPAAARDEANRLMLGATRAGLQARLEQLHRSPLTPAEQAEFDALTSRTRAIDRILTRLEDAPTKNRAYLLGFDNTDLGKAIIAVGDPDTADNIVTFVPGTGAKLDHIGADLDRADIMARDAGLSDPDKSSAAIVWIGYEAPQTIPQASHNTYAIEAGAQLDRFLDGLRETHQGTETSHNTVIGHSYGSTVVGYTAAGHGINADNLIFVGSPGVGTPTVSGLLNADGQPIDASRVWSSTAAHDPIQYASITDPNPIDADAHWWPPGIDFSLKPDDQLAHGQNPSEPEFGARHFTTDPGPPVTELAAHSMYWDDGSASLRNITYIVTGQYEKVS